MTSIALATLPHRRKISAAVIIPALSSSLATDVVVAPPSVAMPTSPPTTSSSVGSRVANFHSSASSYRRGNFERNPKIGITLEQLRMAARGQGRKVPICHAEQEKVMNALEAANYENWAIYKYIKEYDKCREDYELNHKGKDKVMMRELNKYLVRRKRK